MKYFFLFLLSCICLSSWGREVINLNHSWRFTPGYETGKRIYTEITLPHMWNQDALAGKADYYRGLGNYERELMIPEQWKGKKLFLYFKGVNTVANVFINGRHAAEHRGGYTAFAVDITSLVKYGEKNVIWVRVNNAPQLDVMPLLGDFNMYGGIYRDVELILTGSLHISLSEFGSKGVYVTPCKVSEKKADLQVKVLWEGLLTVPAALRFSIKDANQKEVLKKELPLTAGQYSVEFPVTVEKPHLWNGRKDPYLYNITVELLAEGKVIDQVRDRIGLRYFRIDPEKGFFLNGEHLQLRGVCRHQDRAEIGNALLAFHHREDMEIMAEMGVNAVRLAHYP